MTEQCQVHHHPIDDCPWECTLRSPNDEPGLVDCQYVCSECGRVAFVTEARDAGQG